MDKALTHACVPRRRGTCLDMCVRICSRGSVLPIAFVYAVTGSVLPIMPHNFRASPLRCPISLASRSLGSSRRTLRDMEVGFLSCKPGPGLCAFVAWVRCSYIYDRATAGLPCGRKFGYTGGSRKHSNEGTRRSLASQPLACTSG